MNSNPKQPLEVQPSERVTLDQLKHRAEEVSDLAVQEGKRVAVLVSEDSAAKVVLIAVAVVVVAASLAYFSGARAARRLASGDPTP